MTIKYIDSSSSKELEPSTVISNLFLGTYSYTAKSFEGYNLSDESTKSVTLSDTNLDAIVTFSYSKILGSVTIKYIDKSSSVEISPSKVIDKLELGSYSYNAISIDGYSISGDTTKSVILTSTNPNQVITFNYDKILGEVTIRYVEEGTDIDISERTIYQNLELGAYKYTAKSIDGYNVDMPEQSVTLTSTTPKATIIFSYSEILGSVTIKYLVKDSNSILNDSVVYSDLPLGSYSYNALTFNGYTALESTQTVILTKEHLSIIVNFEYEKDIIVIPSDLNINEVPYISTYYIKPIVKPGEEVFIDYYITDYYYKEYMESYNLKEGTWGDDNWTEAIWNDEIFTVTVRVEGQPDRIYPGLKAGDHHVSLGRFANEGEQNFSIVCSDKYDRSSHELFNFFLVQGDVEIKEYIMTKDDLLTYNIKNTDDYEEKVYVKVDKLTDATTGTKIEEVANSTVVPSKKYICFIGTTETDTNGNPIMQTTAARFWLNTIVKYADDYDKNAVLAEATNTRIGLQKLLDDKKLEGYNKLLLLPGKYRIDNNGTIYIPTEFTLDMNNSTLKENQFAGSSCLMLSLDGTFNSHVINGNIEGDYFSHDYANSPNNSEWPMGVSIAGPCKYSSFENMVIKDITGYGGGNGISKKYGYTYFANALGNIFKLGDISILDGSDISSTTRQRTAFINISNYSQYEYIAINKYLGYQGVLGGSWNLILHFYDINKNYIKSISAFQYRRSRIPSNSYFMKITILSSTASNDFWMVYFKYPCHCNFSNIEFTNCRCIGLAQSAMNDMLVDNCKFTLNGQSGAFCAYDAEDGWDQMQDVTIKNCNFSNNYRNDFLTCAGHNFIIDGQASGKIYMWERTRSSVIINCNNTNITLQSGGISTILKHGIYRVYDNNFIIGSVANNLSKNNSCISSLSGVILKSSMGAYGDNSFYNNCTVTINTSFYCKLYKISMINCILKPTLEFADRYKILFMTGHEGSYYFKNCSFLGKCSLGDNADFYSGQFIKCNFENVNIFPNVNANSNDSILFENCSINCNENNLIYYRPFAYTKGTFTNLEFIDCIITINKTTSSLIYSYAKPNGSCSFNNCNFNISSIFTVFDGYPSYINNITDYSLKFINSPLPENMKLISDIFKSNENIKITLK